MRQTNGLLSFSATDLANFLGCSHATELDRAVAEGRENKDFRNDRTLELLKELGKRHEKDYLDSLRDRGLSVVELPQFDDPTGELTMAAMRNKTDVIFQATLLDDPWQGFADFLINIDESSELGNWSYEVSDTKLSHETKAAAVLQLCLYTEIVAKLQGFAPLRMHIVKPSRNPIERFDIDSPRVVDFMACFVVRS